MSHVDCKPTYRTKLKFDLMMVGKFPSELRSVKTVPRLKLNINPSWDKYACVCMFMFCVAAVYVYVQCT